MEILFILLALVPQFFEAFAGLFTSLIGGLFGGMI